MHRNVEVAIGRLVTDPDLLRRFEARPLAALREQGLELTALELEAVASIDPASLRTFAEALDARLRRASIADDSQDRVEDGSAPSTGRGMETMR